MVFGTGRFHLGWEGGVSGNDEMSLEVRGWVIGTVRGVLSGGWR